MVLDLAFTPSGRLTVADPVDGPEESGQWNGREGRVARAFSDSQGEGLFALATERIDAPLAPSLIYWRDFASRYLTQLCHLPESGNGRIEPLLPPASGELATMILGVPPMRGAEYVSIEGLKDLWGELDGWVRDQVAFNKKGLSGYLRDRAPLWHQVGRVSFHLAENRRDPDAPFAFLATYAPTVSAGGRVQYQPLSKALQEYAGAMDKPALIKLLTPVHTASQKSSLVRELVDSGDIYHPLAWTPREAYRFLKDVPVLEQSGILVRLPDWWKKRPRPRVGVTIGSKKPKNFGASAMLDFQVRLALGDQTLNEAEWRTLMTAEDDGLVLLKGEWVEVDRRMLREALEHWKKVERQATTGVSFIEGMRLLAGAPLDLTSERDSDEAHREWSFVDAGKWLSDLLADLRNPENLTQAKPGRELKATLRAYQEVGVEWLWLMTNLGLGACLADDMGLGKTIQVLAVLLLLKKSAANGPALLVLPASLLANWKSEMQRFTPALRFITVHPSEAGKDELAGMARDPQQAIQHADVVLTTYGMLLRLAWLADIRWRVIVLDEAQAIKNPAARQTKAVKRLEAHSRFALTGTPVENRLSDLWSLFDFLCPGLLGTQKKFSDFVKSMEASEKNRYAPLRRLVGPYILRRLKTDKRVIADLPDKTEMRAYCGLSKRQAAIYAKLVQELSAALDGVEGMQRRGLVLAYLLRFKQLCNHPSQLSGDGKFAPEESGKFSRLGEIADEIALRQEKALVFTQFREMTEPLCAFLTRVFGRGGCILHGGTAVKHRQTLIDEFQRDGGPPFFVLSLKAGGTGLNLTAASHVIHFDRWWNPAVENQATDRAFRIGQHRNVLVHKFVCRGTVEEKIDEMIDAKSALAEDLLAGGAEKMLTEMSNKELIQLVSLDIDKASV